MPLLVVTALLLLPALALFRLGDQFEPWLVAILVIVPSLVGFILIAQDKNRARRGLWRTPESTLHAIELLGGWPGSYLAQQRFRHKTAKRSYRFTFWTIVVLHQVVAIDALRGWPWIGQLRQLLGL